MGRRMNNIDIAKNEPYYQQGNERQDIKQITMPGTPRFMDVLQNLQGQPLYQDKLKGKNEGSYPVIVVELNEEFRDIDSKTSFLRQMREEIISIRQEKLKLLVVIKHAPEGYCPKEIGDNTNESGEDVGQFLGQGSKVESQR